MNCHILLYNLFLLLVISVNSIKRINETAFTDIINNIIHNITKNHIKLKKHYSSSYKPAIPLIIHQIWPKKITSDHMNKTINNLIEMNKEFEYKLYDDNDCRKIIKRQFSKMTLYSFDHLRPGAYKADLCRYCLLYHYGGIYVDIKLISLDNFKFISLTNKEYYVIDTIKHFHSNFTLGLYNGLIITKPKSLIMFKAIELVNKHVYQRYYGENPYYPTGSLVLGEAYIGSPKEIKNNITNTMNKLNQIELINKIHYDNGKAITRIFYHNIEILEPYHEYSIELSQYYTSIDEMHYSYYWHKRLVYSK